VEAGDVTIKESAGTFPVNDKDSISFILVSLFHNEDRFNAYYSPVYVPIIHIFRNNFQNFTKFGVHIMALKAIPVM
jgi:hypothetical protein